MGCDTSYHSISILMMDKDGQGYKRFIEDQRLPEDELNSFSVSSDVKSNVKGSAGVGIQVNDLQRRNQGFWLTELEQTKQNPLPISPSPTQILINIST
ncbi:hypothetical protein Q3G72_015015 [Acer saccharum]|nr:hypothetical protein Q3G72_015015 [Acer saccharum]